MEVTAIQKYIHTSPRKLQLVADMVRKMSPVAALNALRFTQKSATTPLVKAIQTALANAKQQNLEAEQLTFKKLEINQSMAIKRGRAGSRGRVDPFKRKMSHIKIVLTDDVKIKDEKLNIKNKETKEGKEAKIKVGSK